MDERRSQTGVALTGTVVFVLAGMLVACSSNSSRTESLSTVPPPGRDASLATVSFTPAPRSCPVGIGETGTRLVERGEILRAMHGHVPVWLPSGFGFADGWSAEDSAWVVWSDEHCRLVTVSYNGGEQAAASWTLDYNNARACGNYVMGMGRCIGYTRGVTGGQLGVQAIGLTLIEASRVVQSIPS